MSRVVLTPVRQGLIRLERDVASENALHVGGGQHTGIVVNKQAEPGAVACWGKGDVSLEFTVFLVNASSGSHSQERRKLKFWFTEAGSDSRFQVAQEFFKHLLKSDEFPRDYAGFIKRMMKLMQAGYLTVLKLEVEMRPVEEPAVQPPTKQAYEATIWDRALQGQPPDQTIVQEVLEHAYPSALAVDVIAKSLHASDEQVLTLLEELEKLGLASRAADGLRWSRTASHLEQRVGQDVKKAASGPTVAIITALYVEKLAVDAMIENRQTYVRYKTDGESNVYTLGEIGAHRVVATKLSAVGHTREAMIAAGSITTRLLGGFQSIEHVLIVGVGGGVPHYVPYCTWIASFGL